VALVAVRLGGPPPGVPGPPSRAEGAADALSA